MMAQIPARITPRNYCRRRSSVNRNCSSSNLIRIPRLKSVKTKQVLPNILSLNARSILTKTDELALVIHNQKSDIVMVSETWLSDVIPDEALHFPGIPGFSVIRTKWLAHLPFTSEAAGSSLSENFLNATRTQSSCEKSKSQRSAESRGFPPGTPVSSHRES